MRRVGKPGVWVVKILRYCRIQEKRMLQALYEDQEEFVE